MCPPSESVSAIVGKCLPIAVTAHGTPGDTNSANSETVAALTGAPPVTPRIMCIMPGAPFAELASLAAVTAMPMSKHSYSGTIPRSAISPASSAISDGELSSTSSPAPKFMLPQFSVARSGCASRERRLSSAGAPSCPPVVKFSRTSSTCARIACLIAM